MPAKFSFRTFSDPSSTAGVDESKRDAPDSATSEGEASGDEVDDCYYGDQAEEDKFRPEESSDSGTDPDYETEDSDEGA
jgi:hypothetical protein